METNAVLIHGNARYLYSERIFHLLQNFVEKGSSKKMADIWLLVHLTMHCQSTP